jgi:CHAT domain-containing protein
MLWSRISWRFRTSRWIWVTAAVVVVSCRGSVEPFPASEVDRFVGEFYAKAVSPNAAAFQGLWSTTSVANARPRWGTLRGLLGLDRPPTPQSCSRAVEGDRLILHIEPNADHGQPTNRERCHRLVLVRESGALKVFEESSPWEALARQVLESGTLPSAQNLAPELGRALRIVGGSHESAGENDQAMRAFILIREVGRQLANKEIEVTGLLDIGYLHGSLEQYAQGEAVLEEGLRIAKASANELLEARTMSNLGVLNFAQAKYTQALRLYEEGLRIAEAKTSKRDISRIALNLAAVQIDVAAYRDAHRNLMKARTLSQQLGEANVEASALHNLGDLSLTLGDHQQAVDYYQQSLSLKESLGNTISAANTMQSLGEAHIRAGRDREALAILGECRRRVADGKDEITEAYALDSLGVAYFNLGKLAESANHLNQSLALTKRVGDPTLEAATRIHLGRTLFALGNRVQARTEFVTAERLSRTAGAKMERWGALASLARLELAMRRLPAARRYAQDAIETIETLREEAGGQHTRQTFFEDKLEPYHVMLATAVAADRFEEALEYSERARARVLLDTITTSNARITSGMSNAERQQEDQLQLELYGANKALLNEQQAEVSRPNRLEDLSRRRDSARSRLSTFRAALYANRPGLAAKRLDVKWPGPESVCRAAVAGSVAILEYTVTESEVFLFAIGCQPGMARASLAVHRLAISTAALSTAAEDFRGQLAARDLRFQDRAKELFRTLVEPVRSSLEGRATLLIVPDGPLWGVPFQALMDGDRYIVEQFAVAYAPSLSVLTESTPRVLNPQQRWLGTLLAMGNPSLGTNGAKTASGLQLRGRRFASVPEAEREVAELRKLYGAERTAVHTGAEASEKIFKAEAAKYGVLHLATHSIADDQNPAHSFVLFASPSGTDGEDGLLESWEVMELDLNADMVVLSACETARGRYGAGEGMLGLSWAFFIAGTTTTIASQWEVESGATTRLMVRFHRELLADSAWIGSVLSKARALQRAARETIATDPDRHPFYWAGFVAIGTRL